MWFHVLQHARFLSPPLSPGVCTNSGSWSRDALSLSHPLPPHSPFAFNLPQFSSIQSLSCVLLFATPWTAAYMASLSITNSQSLLKLCPLSGWCHPAISSSVILFFSYFQSFPESGSFLVSQFFLSGGQSIGVSASTSGLPIKIQDWFPLGWTSWISSQSKGLSRTFSNTTVQRHQFFGTQLSF